jgi:hypothetical protein
MPGSPERSRPFEEPPVEAREHEQVSHRDRDVAQHEATTAARRDERGLCDDRDRVEVGAPGALEHVLGHGLAVVAHHDDAAPALQVGHNR